MAKWHIKHTPHVCSFFKNKRFLPACLTALSNHLSYLLSAGVIASFIVALNLIDVAA